VTGTTDAGDAFALAAQNDATAAYTSLSLLASTPLDNPDLSGVTLTPGVYSVASSAALNGVLTLDFENDANTLFFS
jgi:hypothetical protein